MQVTKHTDGNLFWPSMSSDGKVIVYEDNFGIWKLDVASGKTTEIKLDIATDEKENEVDVETVSNEVDCVRHLAVRPARGHLGARPDPHDRDRPRRHHARRARQDGVAQRVPEVVARRQVHRLRLGSIRAATKSGSRDPEGKSPKKITDLDNEKGALVWTPDSKALLYTAADKKLYSYTVADGKTTVVTSSDVGRIGSVVGLARQQVGRVLQAGPHAALARLHRRRSAAARSVTSRTTACSTPRTTPSGPPTAATSSSRRSKARATASPRRAASTTTMALWALSLRDQDRDPMNRDIDNEAQGLAAEAAARQNAGRGGGATRRRSRSASTGTASPRRARRLTVPGTTIGGLTPAPEGHSVALTVSTGGAGGGRGAGAAADPTAGMYIINVESGQLTRVPPAPPQTAGRGGRRRGGGGGGFGGGGSMVFARDGRTLYFRSGGGLFAATAPAIAAGARRGAGRGGGGRGGRGGGRGAASETAATGRRRARRRDR